MARRGWVYIGGVAYEKGVDIIPDQGNQAPMIIPDAPDFISPIDQTVVSGRKGLREHCLKHDVVPTQELKGLPSERPMYTPSKAEIRERREFIAHQVDVALRKR